MSIKIKTGWLTNENGEQFAPKTLTSQVQTNDGTPLEVKIQEDLTKVEQKIVQADWDQTDSTKTDFIKNKPDLFSGDYNDLINKPDPSSFGLNEDQVIETVFGLGKYTEDLDFVYDSGTQTWNKDPIGVYWGNKNINLGYTAYGVPPVTGQWWVVKGELIADTNGHLPYLKQTLLVGVYQREWYRFHTPDTSGWTAWRTNLDCPSTMYESNKFWADTLVGYVLDKSGATAGVTSACYYLGNFTDQIPVRGENGNIVVPITPDGDDKATSKAYVDQYQVKIENRAKRIITEQIRIGDIPREDFGGWDGEGEADVYNTVGYIMPLPAQTDENTQYTVKVLNYPDTHYPQDISDSYAYPGIGIAPKGDRANYIDGWCTPEYIAQGFNAPLGLHYYDAGSLQVSEQTITGPWILFLMNSMALGFVDEEGFQDFLNFYKDTIIEYTYEIQEGEYLGPVHDIELHSNQELHYDHPLTELIIEKFVESYPSNMSQEWTISFIAGDEDPLVILPSNVKWAIAEPVFEANKKYLVTFKKIINTYTGIWTVIG